MELSPLVPLETLIFKGIRSDMLGRLQQGIESTPVLAKSEMLQLSNNPDVYTVESYPQISGDFLGQSLL